MKRRLALVLCLSGLALPLSAAQPQFFKLEGAADFLEGELSGLSVDSDGRVRLGDMTLPVPPGTGEAITLGVRPEELEPAPPGEGFPAHVVVAEPLGPHVLLTLTYDGQQVRYTAPPHVAAGPGDVINLRPTPAGLRWFDTETGKTLQQPN